MYLEGGFEESALWRFESEDIDISAVITEHQMSLGIWPVRCRPIVHAVRHKGQGVQVVLRACGV